MMRGQSVMALHPSTELASFLHGHQIRKLADLKDIRFAELIGKANPAVCAELIGQLQGILEPMPRLPPPPPLVSSRNANRRPTDMIKIPPEARKLPLQKLARSVRLAHVFDTAGFRELGDLHGWRWSDFGKFRNCGKKTIADLHRLVLRAQRNVVAGAILEVEDAEAAEFIIPAAAQPVEFSQLPISNRLAGVLKKYGFERMGDLQGLRPKDFRPCRNCGTGTLKELAELVKRAQAGEFDPPACRVHPSCSPASMSAWPNCRLSWHARSIFALARGKIGSCRCERWAAF